MKPRAGKTYLGTSALLGGVSFRVTRVTKRRVFGVKSWRGQSFSTSMTHRQFAQMIAGSND